jgi:hypothetical protein
MPAKYTYFLNVNEIALTRLQAEYKSYWTQLKAVIDAAVRGTVVSPAGEPR